MEQTGSSSNVKIVCYKISSKLDLSALQSYFDDLNYEINSKYILLNDKAISSILKVHSSSKLLYIYEYGCMVFVDFSSDEIFSTLEYLENITGTVDYKLISQFNENLILTINESRLLTRINDFQCKLEYNNDVLSIACGLISKSTALSATEAEIATVLDDADNIVNYLQKAKLRINRKEFVSSISHMSRFQYSIIRSLGLFDSTFSLKRDVNIKSFYSILYHYYEIDDRINILESKIDEINRLISSYTTLSYNMGEMRLLIFECILLSMFFVPHLINIKALFR
jgi:required for meiotic nuclear division protein 1